MHNDGLFIPMENYVESYCSSDKHKRCRYLTGSSSTSQNTSISEKITMLHDTIDRLKH